MKADIDLWPDGRSPSERERNTEMPNGRSVVFISFAAPVPMAASYSPPTRLHTSNSQFPTVRFIVVA